MTSEPSLPRRPYLGLGVRPSEDGIGLEITRVLDGSIGAAAGLTAGDRLLEVDGHALDSVAELKAALRGASERAHLWIRVERDGAPGEREVPVVPFPLERIEGARVELGHVVVGGARLRTFASFPTERTPWASVMILPGIACATVDFAGLEQTPTARLVAALAAEGLATLRVERHGIGDSEGPPCADTDFDTEHAALGAALDAWRTDPRVDPARVVLFGHSVGGMHAPLLARRTPVGGVVAYGSSARRWTRCLRDGLARQLSLRGASDDEIREELGAFDADPLPRAGAHGRSAAYHRQIERADLAEAWWALSAPVLVIAGEYDWVVGQDEQREIAELARDGRLVSIPGLDHALTAHPSLDASLEALGAGAPAAAPIARAVARFAREALER